MGRHRKLTNGRVAFTPSSTARAYLDQLVDRLKAEHGLDVRITLREAFDHMVDLAQLGEKMIPHARAAGILPPLANPPSPHTP